MISVKDYSCYQPGLSLEEAFSPDAIPVLQMEHLRQMDFMINRGFSYELTLYSFLLQLIGNEGLRPLREFANMVVLLNEEGAIMRDEERWLLYFRPEAAEGTTLAADADLLPVYQKLLEDYENGAVKRIDVSVATMISSILRQTRISILDEYCRRYPGGYLAVAERIVRQGTDELFANVPVCRYGALATVDMEEIESYRSIKYLLDDYIHQFDHRENGTPLQPLSIAVFGAPGSGKSFGVKQIARSCGRFAATTLNLSQFESPEELFTALDQALSGSEGQIPLIFFDEFDSDLKGVSRGWLKYLLAPMQDGEFMRSGQTRRIDCTAFVFAGGTVTSFKEFLPQTPEQNAAFKAVKGPDFISRLKGTLNIKGPNPTDITDNTYIIRRAMLLRDLILRKFPGICDARTGEASISTGLLSSLLRVSEYRHGTRSLEFILAMSRLSGVNHYTSACLPMPEQLDIHLDIADFSRKLMFEQIAGGMLDQYARAAHAAFLDRQRLSGEYDEAAPECAEWEALAEPYREEYRSQFRYYGEHLSIQGDGLTLRPIRPGRGQGLTELYGPVLERLAQAEHERLCQRQRSEGWRQGDVYNAELRITPFLTPYDELPEGQKDALRLAARDVPALLNTIGFELVKSNHRP